MTNLLYSLELPMYHKWHAVLNSDLTDAEKTFDRGQLGLSKRDADQIFLATGCKRLEEYLVRLSLNDQAFANLVRNCLGGAHTEKAIFLITQMRNMVRDVTILHRVAFLMRQRFKDRVC